MALRREGNPAFFKGAGPFRLGTIGAGEKKKKVENNRGAALAGCCSAAYSSAIGCFMLILGHTKEAQGPGSVGYRSLHL